MPPTDPKELLKRYRPKPLKVLKNDQQLCLVRFSPDGKVLAAGTYETALRRWDFSNDSFAELPPLKGHDGWVQALAFHPDNRRLFSGDSWGRLCCWPFAESQPKPLWSVKEAHDGWLRRVAVSPDGKAVATCGRDGLVRLWSPEGKKLQEFAGHGEDVLALAFHPDGKSLVSGDVKGVIKQWDLASGKATRQFDAKAMYLLDRIQDVGCLRFLTFDGSGATLIAAGGQPKTGAFVQATPLILFFDWADGKLKHTIKGANDTEGFVYDVAPHPDGFVMAVSSGQPGNGKLFFQRPGDAQPFFTQAIPNCHALAVHPNGSRLVVSATNANSSGNGRQIGKGKEYPGNYSPLHVLDMPKPAS